MSQTPLVTATRERGQYCAGVPRQEIGRHGGGHAHPRLRGHTHPCLIREFHSPNDKMSLLVHSQVCCRPSVRVIVQVGRIADRGAVLISSVIARVCSAGYARWRNRDHNRERHCQGVVQRRALLRGDAWHAAVDVHSAV